MICCISYQKAVRGPFKGFDLPAARQRTGNLKIAAAFSEIGIQLKATIDFAVGQICDAGTIR